MREMRYKTLKCCKCPAEFIHAYIHETNSSREWEPEGNELCVECTKKYVTCVSCNKYILKNKKLKKTITWNDKLDCVCKDCETGYVECPTCHLLHKKGFGAMTRPYNIELCKGCATKAGFKNCSCCQDWFQEEDLDDIEEKNSHCAFCLTKRHEHSGGNSSESWAPTYYSDVCNEALEVQKKYNLNDAQTLIYNHICRGDFYLRNDTGRDIYDLHKDKYEVTEQNLLDTHSKDRQWVKKQLNVLIKAKMVKFESLRDCRSKQCVSWVFYNPKFKYDDLVDAQCFATTHVLALIKHYLKLPDGFDKRNKTYGKVKFLYKKGRYGFEYKGQEPEFNFHAKDFGEMVHDLWEMMEKDGYKDLGRIKGYNAWKKYKI